jgi:hypothetical protein
MARRKAPGKRWSATSSLERYAADGTKIEEGSDAAVAKAIVRWRLDGSNRSATCTGLDPIGPAWQAVV